MSSSVPPQGLRLGFKTTIEAYDQPFCRTTNLKLNDYLQLIKAIFSEVNPSQDATNRNRQD